MLYCSYKELLTITINKSTLLLFQKCYLFKQDLFRANLLTVNIHVTLFQVAK
jgi:hypothetical protein